MKYMHGVVKENNNKYYILINKIDISLWTFIYRVYILYLYIMLRVLYL